VEAGIILFTPLRSGSNPFFLIRNKAIFFSVERKKTEKKNKEWRVLVAEQGSAPDESLVYGDAKTATPKPDFANDPPPPDVECPELN